MHVIRKPSNLFKCVKPKNFFIAPGTCEVDTKGPLARLCLFQIVTLENLRGAMRWYYRRSQFSFQATKTPGFFFWKGVRLILLRPNLDNEGPCIVGDILYNPVHVRWEINCGDIKITVCHLSGQSCVWYSFFRLSSRAIVPGLFLVTRQHPPASHVEHNTPLCPASYPIGRVAISIAQVPF